MKKKRSKEDPLTTLFKLGLLVAAGLGFYVTETFAGAINFAITAAGVLITIYIITYFLKNKTKNEKLLRSGIYEVDQMDGFQFESYLKQLFKNQQYKVIKTPDRNDFGADLLLEKNGSRIVVQAKRYKGNVGIKAVQEIQSARLYYKAEEAWVMTNSNYTKSAKELAVKTDVKLLGRNELIDFISQLNPNGEVSAAETLENVKPKPIRCKCGSEMIVKRNKVRNQNFYGCTNFPECKHTKAL